MGQYYKPINIDKMVHVSPHTYNNGLKLMEHSYLNNNFMSVIEELLSPLGPWHKCHFMWCGDYADESGELYDKSKEIKAQESDHHYRCIVNFDKQEYVDKQKLKIASDGWTIHPLPLLTSSGNGRGGGDFRGSDPKELVGCWKGDRIGLFDMIPEGDWKELEFDLTE